MDNDNSTIQQQQQPSNALGKTKRRSGPRSRSSPYKGVTQYKRTGKWEAHIWIPGNARGKGHQRHLGSYHTAEDAARCFDRATIHVRGTQEELNFPLSNYDNDEFLLEHAKTEKFKFLDLMRDKFAIASAEITKYRTPSQPRAGRAKSNANRNSTDSGDDNDDGDDPDFYMRGFGVNASGGNASGGRTSLGKRGSPSSLPTFTPKPRANLSMRSPRTTLISRMLFKQQQQSPNTPQSTGQANQAAAVPVATTTPVAGGSLHALAPVYGGGGRLVEMLADEARLSMERLNNYTRMQQQQQQRRQPLALEEEDEEEEEDVHQDVYTFLQQHQYQHQNQHQPHQYQYQQQYQQQQQPPLFSPAETAWINAATPPNVSMNTNMGGGVNRSATLSFANTIAGLSLPPAAATKPPAAAVAPCVLPSRYIGTCGPLLPPPPAFPTVYNALQFPPGAASAYALQESFLLPSILQTVGAGAGGGGGRASGSGGSSGSGHGDLDPATEDLLAGIQMISGQEASPMLNSPVDWLYSNSPRH